MTDAVWHYTDAAGEQRGPLTAEAIRDGLASGEIPANARFWRYGLVDWVDRATVAAELGLPPPPAPAPQPGVGRPVAGRAVVVPAKPKSGMSGCLIAAIVIAVFGLFVVAILAAIAIPQYNDYVQRAQVSEGAYIGGDVKLAVAEQRQVGGAYPADNAAAGVAAPDAITGQYVGSVAVVDGRIVVTFSSRLPQKAHASLDGKSLVFTPAAIEGSEALEWQCHSDSILQRHCPSSCSCQ